MTTTPDAGLGLGSRISAATTYRMIVTPIRRRRSALASFTSVALAMVSAVSQISVAHSRAFRPRLRPMGSTHVDNSARADVVVRVLLRESGGGV